MIQTPTHEGARGRMFLEELLEVWQGVFRQLLCGITKSLRRRHAGQSDGESNLRFAYGIEVEFPTYM